MRKLSIGSLLIITAFSCFGQTETSEYKAFGDRLYKELSVATSDTTRINLWIQLVNFHKFNRADSGIYYATKALALSRSIQYHNNQAEALNFLSLCYSTLGDYAKALRISREELRIREQMNDVEGMPFAYMGLGGNYYNLGNLRTSVEYYNKACSLFKENNNYNFEAMSRAFLARSLLGIHEHDSALKSAYEAKEQAERLKINWVLAVVYHDGLGEIHRNLGNVDSALFYYRKSYDNYFEMSAGKAKVALDMAKLYQEREQLEPCLYYANEALRIAVNNKQYENVVNISQFLTGYYEQDNPVAALRHSNRAFTYADSLFEMSRMISYEDFEDYDQQQRQFELESAEQAYQSRIRTNTLLGITFIVLIFAFFLYRNGRLKHKAKQKIETAFDQLKSTQSQLIQSEKMASLGELTAGIAHEIQNPLNFVNNFSEVNKELADELEQEINNGNTEDAKAIARDIKENQEKILHHGKRADAIVKGMLQHSRTSSGQKELTDINALCDEYLRLSYHGLRAKDKTFNAKFETDFDLSLPKINVVPQDIGRVILNLINNAFYAVNTRANNHQRTTTNEPYTPTVSVSTKNNGDTIEIRVSDNGPGIPDAIKEKIFQPFFTTKPTGQGTGLGLSLSYDIIKAHGGVLKVETKEVEGSEFIFSLPS